MEESALEPPQHSRDQEKTEDHLAMPSVQELQDGFHGHVSLLMSIVQEQVISMRNVIAADERSALELSRRVAEMRAEMERRDEELLREVLVQKVELGLADEKAVKAQKKWLQSRERETETIINNFWATRVVFGADMPVVNDDHLFDAADMKGRRQTTKKHSNLPISTVKLLKEWMVAHIEHPFPTIQDKEEMALKCDMSVKQVGAWMTNCRRRLLVAPEPGGKKWTFKKFASAEEFLNGNRSPAEKTTSAKKRLPSGLMFGKKRKRARKE